MADEGSRTILVTGVVPDISEETLELFFESSKRSGGGKIESIDIDYNTSTATITFMENEVAEQVLQRGGLMLKNKYLQTSRREPLIVAGQSACEEPSDIKSLAKAIMVSGLKHDTDQEILELFFENEKRSGGADVASIDVDQATGRAIIHFVEEGVAQRVVERSPISFQGCELNISVIMEQPTVKVVGIAPNITKEMLELFFENTKRSGGGDIKCIDLYIEHQLAFITFEEPEAMERVAERHEFSLSGSRLVAEKHTGLKKCPQIRSDADPFPLGVSQETDVSYRTVKGAGEHSLSVPRDLGMVSKTVEEPCASLKLDKEYSGESSSDETDTQSCTIEVSNINPQTSTNTLEMFFRSRKKSGGGHIERIWHNVENSTYTITFKEREVVERILRRNRIALDGYDLNVKELQSIASKSNIAVPTEPHLVYILGLNDNISPDQLELTLDECVDCDVERIHYGQDPSVALVKFKERINFKQLRRSLSRRPIEGSMLGMEGVPYSTTLQVLNIGQLTKDSLETYFENNRRSGGSGVVKVDLHPDEKYALAQFESPLIAQNVLQRSSHDHENQRLQVSLFRDRLGLIPLGHDSTKPCMPIPEDLLIDNLDTYLVKYLKSVPEAKKYAESLIEPNHATVNWDHKVDSELHIICIIDRDSKRAQILAKEWKTRIKVAMRAIEESFITMRRPCIKNIWDDICTESRKKSDANRSVAVFENDENKELVIVGKSQDVEIKLEQLDVMCKGMEERLEHITDTTKLGKHDLMVIKHIEFVEGITRRHPKLKVVLDEKKGELTLDGTAKELLLVQKEVIACLRSIIKKTIPVSKGQLKILLLLKPYDDNQLAAEMKKTAPNATLDMNVQQSTVLILGIGGDVSKAEDILTNTLKEIYIEANDEEKSALQGDLWTTFANTLFAQTGGAIHLTVSEDMKKVNLVALTKDFDGALECVQRHIQKNSIKQIFLEMDSAYVRLIQQFQKKDLESIEHDFKSYHIKIDARLNESRPGFNIQGTEDGLDSTKLRIEKMAQAIIIDVHAVSSPGMPYYFIQHETGRFALKGIEAKHHVVIQSFAQVDKQKLTSQKEKQPIAARRGETTLGKAKHSTGVVLKVVVGDMTAHPIDCMVNAANSNLQHVGGLAKAISDKGGKVIQDESNVYLKGSGPVMVGHAVLTSPGKLPCKGVIHAVGPHWNQGKHGESDILYDCIYSVLELSKMEGFTSVAIPAISAGVFGFPLHESTNVIAEAIHNYLNEEEESIALKEVILIDNKREGGQAFVAALQKHYAVYTDTALDNKAAPSNKRKSKSSPSKQSLKPSPIGSANGSQIPGSTYPNMRTKEGLVLTLKKGTIAKEKADIILNTTSADLSLNSGAVSKSIYQAAGDNIQTEVLQKCPNGISAGQMVISSGGNMRCKNIYHSVLCNWDGGSGPAQQALSKLIMDAMKTAQQSGNNSIAFPAMGTGNLKFPHDVVASAMFQTVINFSQKYPTTTLKDVRFVLYDQDKLTVDAFEKEYQRQALSTAVQTSAAPDSGTTYERKVKPTYRNVEMDEMEEVGAVGGYVHTSMSGKQSEEMTQEVQGGEMVIGHIRLQVVTGDITQERTDVIVNGTNQRLDFTVGAVSQAILKAAGPMLQEECANKGINKPGNLVVSTGGNLSAKCVIHLDVQGLNSKSKWKEAVKKCLQKTKQKQLHSISFPALGTGQLNNSPEDMAVAMMEAIAEFCKKNTQSLSCVRVVIFQPEMVSTYHKKMDAASKPGSSIVDMITKPFRYIGHAFKSFTEMLGHGAGVDTSVSESDEEGQIPTMPDVQKHTASVDLMILGLHKRNIENAKKEIERCSSVESQDSIISEEYSEIIKSLTQEQKNNFSKLQMRFGVKITVDQGQRQGRIRIQGYTRDVMAAETRIREVLLNHKVQTQQEQDAAILKQLVQWEFEAGTQFYPYPAELNIKIEKAFHNNNISLPWTEIEADGNEKKCIIDLKNMTETVGTTMKKVQVNRRVISQGKADISVPKSWTPMSGTKMYELVALAKTDQEYITVEQAFASTCPRVIQKIERLQNIYLYRRYMVHKEDLDVRNPKTTVNEKLLWHGTGGDSMDNINTNGFNRSYCGQNGTAYGQGVYFAVNAKYSMGYSKPDQNGACKMYYARVLTGQYTQGNRVMKTPPSQNDPTNPSKQYDSTVDNPNTPNMFIIYYDTQAYPEFIVTFK